MFFFFKGVIIIFFVFVYLIIDLVNFNLISVFFFGIVGYLNDFYLSDELCYMIGLKKVNFFI